MRASLCEIGARCSGGYGGSGTIWGVAGDGVREGDDLNLLAVLKLNFSTLESHAYPYPPTG